MVAQEQGPSAGQACGFHGSAGGSGFSGTVDSGQDNQQGGSFRRAGSWCAAVHVRFAGSEPGAAGRRV
jgi:hypothetical protein